MNEIIQSMDTIDINGIRIKERNIKKSYNTNGKSSDDIMIYYMNEFIGLGKSLLPNLVQKEKKNILISNEISKINDVVESLITSL